MKTKVITSPGKQTSDRKDHDFRVEGTGALISTVNPLSHLKQKLEAKHLSSGK